MRKLKSSPFLLLVSYVVFQAGLFAQSDSTHHLPGIFDLLTIKEVAEITIRTDLDSLMAKKRTTEYVQATFEFERGKKQTMTLPVRIKSRGKFRRMKCNFPPLKLKFRKDDLAAHGLNAFNELKLVTHCTDEKTVSKEMILRECLVYKLFNELTTNSLRVQLVRITYEGTGKGSGKMKQWGILIEDSEEMASRVGGHVYEKMGIAADSIHANQEKIVSLFQFMVSNTDWSYELNRNIELVKLGNGTIVPVPYDFDFSGIVMAPYARPDVSKGQKNMRDRYFQGLSPSTSSLKNTIHYFKSKKDELFGIIDNFDQLEEPSKEDIRVYIAEFYKMLDDETLLTAKLFPPPPLQKG